MPTEFGNLDSTDILWLSKWMEHVLDLISWILCCLGLLFFKSLEIILIPFFVLLLSC